MLFTAVLVGLLLSQAPAPAPAHAAAAGADLIESAKNGDLARTRDLLKSGAAVNTVDRRGFTPLTWAAASGNLEMVRLLLENGAINEHRSFPHLYNFPREADHTLDVAFRRIVWIPKDDDVPSFNFRCPAIFVIID